VFSAAMLQNVRVLLCAACGSENGATAKFCSECGARLVAGAPVVERKVVTVLFADLVGFTSLSERLDVEDVHGTLAPFHRSAREVLENFGGTVEKFIGDAVVAVFGAPVAREDDPERAVRSGLAIIERVRDLGSDLHVRIGVNTGEALVAMDVDPQSGEGFVSGDVVNTAARLQSAAPIDRVIVGEATFRATRRQIIFEPLGAITAKGKAQPVSCWIARSPRSIVRSPVADAGQFVGRAPERRVLIETFEACRAERKPHVVTIVGVAGIGKSRLVGELSQHIESETDLTVWRHGHVRSYGQGIAFSALAEIVRQQCGILESDDRHTSVTKLDAAIAVLGMTGVDARWARNQVGALIGVDSATDGSGRREAFAGWRLFLTAVASATPAVVVIDDLHWADDGLIAFVDELIERVDDVPMLIVATTRPEFLERYPAWAEDKPDTSLIALGPLSRVETEMVVEAIIDRTLLSADTEGLLLDRAGGNPLFAQEFVRMLVERGTAATLPETVQGIIAARVDGLLAEEKGLLQDAAVIGSICWLGALCDITGDDRDHVDALLRKLERKQLVRRERVSRIEGETEIAFTHALIRDVAYGQLPRATRARLHERAAVWFERVGSESADAVELIADHYAEALSLYRALGHETSDLRACSRRAHTDAARAAAARHDHSAVLRHTSAGLALDPGSTEQAELRVLAAVAGYTAGAPDEAALLEARTAAESAGRMEDAVQVGCLLIEWANHYAGDAAQTAVYEEEAVRLAADLPPGPIASLPAYYRAFRLSVGGRTNDVISVANHEIDRARAVGAEPAVGLLLVWRGMARIETGEIDAGVADIERAFALLDTYAHPKATVTAYNLGLALTALGRLDEARNAQEQAVATAHRTGDAHNEAAAAIELAELAYHAGRPAEASHALAAVQPGDAWLEFDRSMVAGRLCLDDNPRQAARTARTSATFASQAENQDCLLAVHALRTRAEHALGNMTVAEQTLGKFLELWNTTGATMYLSRYLVEVGLVLAAFGRHDDLAAAVSLVRTSTPWLESARALAHANYDEAARILDSIPSVPLHDAARALSKG
jgi:class 3 adenylate cyclase/ATP/maltotriose-dependent transcriptional regulator MalT